MTCTNQRLLGCGPLENAVVGWAGRGLLGPSASRGQGKHTVVGNSWAAMLAKLGARAEQRPRELRMVHAAFQTWPLLHADTFRAECEALEAGSLRRSEGTHSKAARERRSRQ